MGAILLDGAVLGDDCIVGAGALVTGKTDAPAGSVLLGSPAKVVKEVSEAQKQSNLHSAEHYLELAAAQLEKQP
jgi:carbonic anhydrase/acetyltransferase-like protein (isoleucine patch superfamily)